MKKSSLPTQAYKEFYATYLSVLGDSELMDLLTLGKTDFIQFAESIPEEKLNNSYAVGKWTIAEVLLHIIDTERVFQYRALRFLRNDKTPLPGFDQDHYVACSHANTRSKESLITEFKAVREASINLFLNLNNDDLTRVGIASNIEWTVATLGFVISGHQKHHQIIVANRYLQS